MLLSGLAVAAAAATAACGASTPEAAPSSTAPPASPPAQPYTGSPAEATVIMEGDDPRGPAALKLIAVSDGSHDSLLLEWTGGPANATRWQYRQRRWENMQPLDWGPWTDIPNSGAGTRSYRVTGLRAFSAYDYEVRAVVGSVTATPSPIAETGTTHEPGALPRVFPDQIVEGDGRTQWRIGYLSIAITIPDGVRLVGGGAFISDPCPAPTAAQGEPEPPNLPGCPGGGAGTDLTDLATGSVLTFSNEGVETNRHVVGPAPQRVHDLFDQLMDSVRAVAW